MASSIGRVIVATDDDRIARAVAGSGAEAVMTRPDHPSGTDRVAEAAERCEADIIVNIQGDEPAIEPKLIDTLVGTMASEPQWDMVTAAAPLKSAAEAAPASIVKVVFARDGRALYFSRHAIPFIRNAAPGGDRDLFWRHVGIYLYRRRFLARLVAEPPCPLERAEALEQLRALHIGARIKVVATDHCGVGVDVPADVAAAEATLRSSASRGGAP